MSKESVLARTAKRKAEGADQAYPGAKPRPVKRVVARTALPTLPACVHGGTDADILERCPSCSGGGRHVRECQIHDRCTHEPVNPAVMDCARCRRGGLGYEPLVDRTGWLTVPPPPPLDPRQIGYRQRALVTVVVGEEAERCFAVSGPLMREYADRVGADLVVLRWPGHPSWPMSAKFAIATVLDHYERIAYVDADVLLRASAVNLFDLCAPDEMGACDELPYHRQYRDGHEAAYQRFRAQMGFAPVAALPWYVNAGVMVVPRSHRALLLPPAGPIPPAHCAEQDHTNARLLDSGMRYRLLDRRANWQNWTDHGFRSAPADAVLHWSGAGAGRVSRAEQMRAWAEASFSSGRNSTADC